MRQLQSTLWTKGLLLSPQHLQTQDRFLEDLLDFRLKGHHFCPWGFRELEVDREALTGGTFALSSAEGIFPDGLPFDVPESDPGPEPVPLDDFWEDEERESLELALAVPERRPGGYNVSVDGGEAGNTRYLAEAVRRRDENTGSSERPIQVARKNLRILAETEAREGHSTLPVARIVRTSAGEYALDDGFVPPVIAVGASQHLTSLTRRLVEILSARSATLSAMRRERRKGLADFGVSDVANFWLLYTVNSHLPVVQHLFETGATHPVELYRTMLSLAGSLSTFSTTREAAELPSYDHGDLEGCFEALDGIIRNLLDTVIPSNHVSLTLEATEPSIYATALEDDRYLEASEMYLAVSAALEGEEIASRVPDLVKISSADRMETLVKQALPGLGLRHMPEPPGSLPIKLDHEYFLLDRSGEDWRAIRSARNLAAYVPSDFPSPELELLVVLPGED